MLYEDSLWSVPAAGGSARQVTTMDNAQSFDYHFRKTKVYWVDDESDKVSGNQSFNFQRAPLVPCAKCSVFYDGMLNICLVRFMKQT